MKAHESGVEGIPSKFVNPAGMEAHLKSMGMKPLNRSWAKLEIVIGLGVAVFGFKLLFVDSPVSWAGGLLAVLGTYLAMAGSRSHIYQSLNQQTAYIFQILDPASTTPQAKE